MINLIDIQNAITLRLKNKFPEYIIYVEENKKEIETPSFFVEVRPLLTDQFTKYKNKLINIDIMYFSKDENKRENLIMSELLEELFYLILRVKERRLHIKNINIKEVKDILHCSFSLDFNTDVNIKYNPEIDRDLGYIEGSIKNMEQLHLKDSEGNDV